MNKSLKTIKIMAFAGLTFGATLTSCVSDKNSPGVEYMPDMYRSAAIEPYVDYGEFKGKYNPDVIKTNPALLPPAGTIPVSVNTINDLPYEHGAPVGFDKTHGLYGVEFDTAGYVNAANDINPIPYTKEVKKEGKVLYGKFCIHCHGEKGDGQGSVVTNSNGAFPPPPSYTKQLKDLPEGQIFYSITYGKGLMGSHASQLTKEERWKITHYVQELQGQTKEFDPILHFDAHTDTDGDGVMDSDDQCPDVAGTVENNGCPNVSEDLMTILNNASKGLVFETGSSTIQAKSFSVLDKLVELLQNNSDYKLLINGHTDNVGSAYSNQHLSLKRARSVRDYLVEKGVEISRLEAVGYGQYKPIADNSSEEGRQSNRRVEFRLF
ncbi:MAG TPA: c-type cytochrome [Crocinitomix sp.]|nr:c-type cytochrome [Crocinitomix sp.]